MAVYICPDCQRETGVFANIIKDQSEAAHSTGYCELCAKWARCGHVPETIATLIRKRNKIAGKEKKGNG